MKKDTMIIIPALNEQDSIALVLNDIPKERILEIVVVDNGSNDKTAQIAKSLGATVLFENQKGYGKACLKGLEYVFSKKSEIVIFLDADYSDFPQEISLFFDKIDKGFDLVIGSRLLGKAEQGSLLPQARFGNWLTTFLFKLLFKDKTFTDLGPFRAIKTSKLKQLQMSDENFGWTVEMQLKAIIKKIKYCEVSVSYRKRVGISKITGTFKGTIKAGLIILSTVFKFYIKTIYK